jgi:hypothetical protein
MSLAGESSRYYWARARGRARGPLGPSPSLSAGESDGRRAPEQDRAGRYSGKTWNLEPLRSAASDPRGQGPAGGGCHNKTGLGQPGLFACNGVSRAGPAFMPHHKIHASGSLDNSGDKRLRISSLVDDMAEEENIYDLYASAIELLDEMSSRSMDTVNWNKMLDKAFGNEDVNALNTVIAHLRQRLAAHPGGPAAATAAVPNAHVPASAPPANSAPAEHPPPPAPLPRPQF